jgi:integrase/recombinase XerD
MPDDVVRRVIRLTTRPLPHTSGGIQRMRDCIDRFLNDLQLGSEFSANTVSAYRNDLGQFLKYLDEHCGVASWQQVDATHLTGYVLQMREREYASSTVARKTAAMKTFFGHLVRSGELRADPSESLSAPRVEKYVPKAMSEREILLLLNAPALETTSESLRDLAMLHVLYSTGMRVTELVSLDLDDVDLDAGTVCCTGKQNRRRDVELSPEAIEALRSYLDRGRAAIARNADESALFLNHRGSRLTRQGFWLILKGYASRVGIDHITPHTLRHSFATHQITRGRDLGDVQRILGHVSISTTQVYQRIANGLRPVDGGDDAPVSDGELVAVARS